MTYATIENQSFAVNPMQEIACGKSVATVRSIFPKVKGRDFPTLTCELTEKYNG